MYKNAVNQVKFTANGFFFENITKFCVTKTNGWAFRKYNKTNAAWVTEFVSNHSLDTLTKREALK